MRPAQSICCLPLLRIAILPGPLVDLHGPRHTHQVALDVMLQRIGQLSKSNDAQPQGGFSGFCRITGQWYSQADHSHTGAAVGRSDLRVSHQPPVC